MNVKKRDKILEKHRKIGTRLHKQVMNLCDVISELMKEPASWERYFKLKEAMDKRSLLIEKDNHNWNIMSRHTHAKIELFMKEYEKRDPEIREVTEP
jgi:hypothetical protein